VMLEKVAPNPPGILTFSMHGATKESFEAISVNSNFEECIDLFEAFLAKIDRKEVEVRILCALQARNLMEYAGFYRYLSKWGLLDKFVLVPVFDYGTGGGEERRVLPSAEEIANAAAKIDRDMAECTDAHEIEFMKNWREAILQIRGAEQIVETGPCLVPWFSTYITAKGKVLPCCFLTDEDHVLGNIHEQDFPSIWNGPKYQEFRRRLREGRGQLTGCRTCPRNDANRLRKYNPLSLVPMKWRLNATPDTTPTLNGSDNQTIKGAVPLTVKGRPISETVESPSSLI
jgi:radical SAM protein with 4Fe4S-binding SPASM domain